MWPRTLGVGGELILYRGSNCGSKVPQFTWFCFSVPETETGKLAPPGAGVRRNYNSESSLFHLLGVGALWRGRERGRPRPELERQSFRIWLFPKSGGQKGSFPGALARGRPQAGHCSQNPIPEAPRSLGCSPQPGPLPHHRSLPSFFPFQDSGGAVLLEVEAGRLGRG